MSAMLFPMAPAKFVMLPNPNSVVDSRYKLVQELGEGGFAVVFKASDLELGRTVAIKFLKIAEQDSENLQRFLREAKLIAKLKHPNVVSVYSINFLEEEKCPYIVMEYLEGESLASRVNRCGPLPAEIAVNVFLSLCAGLAHLHENSVLHRDLSPNNIFLSTLPNGELGDAKIIDFGLSKTLLGSSETPEAKLTATGLLIGNPAYMSPEQARGAKLDTRSDIYSLACVFYTAIYGQPPFDADNPVALLYKHQNQAPTFPDLPWNNKQAAEHMIDALRVAMEKDPAKRFQTCTEFTSALRGELTIQKKKTFFGTNPKPVLGASMLALVLVITLLFPLLLRSKKSEIASKRFGSTLKKKSKHIKVPVPLDVFGLLESSNSLMSAGQDKEALQLLNSFKRLDRVSTEELQLIETQKLGLFVKLKMRNDEVNCASKLYSNQSVMKSSFVGVRLLNYFVTNDPEKCVALFEQWQKLHPGERNFAIELLKLRALVFMRKFDDASKFVHSFDVFVSEPVLISDSELADLEQLRLVVACGTGKKIDVVKAVNSLPQRRKSAHLSSLQECASNFHAAGLDKEAITLWLAAADNARKDPSKQLECLRCVFDSPEYREKYLSQVIIAGTQALSLHPDQETLIIIRNSLAWAHRKNRDFEIANKYALENYDYLSTTLAKKKLWSSGDCISMLNAFTTITTFYRDQGKKDEWANLRTKTLALLKNRPEVAALRGFVYLDCAQASLARGDYKELCTFTKEAVEQLASAGRVPKWLLQMPVPKIEELMLSQPSEQVIFCIENLRKAYMNGYPNEGAPLDVLALLSKVYSSQSNREALEKNYKDVFRAITNYKYDASSHGVNWVIWIARIYSKKRFAESLEKQFLQIAEGKRDEPTKASALLALCEWYLDQGQSAKLTSTFELFLRHFQALKKTEQRAYVEISQRAILVALRMKSQSSRELVTQVINELDQKQRLLAYFEAVGYFERFEDYSVCGDFLNKNVAEVSENEPGALLTLYRAEGDCYLRAGNLGFAEKAYKNGMKYARTDVNRGYSTNLLLVNLAEVLESEGKSAEALEVYRKISTTMGELKLLNPKAQGRFLSSWKNAAVKCGTADDQREIENFERLKMSWR